MNQDIASLKYVIEDMRDRAENYRTRAASASYLNKADPVQREAEIYIEMSRDMDDYATRLERGLQSCCGFSTCDHKSGWVPSTEGKELRCTICGIFKKDYEAELAKEKTDAKD